MDPSEVLGVAPGASSAEVRRAFAAAVRLVHPDAGGHGGDAGERLGRLIEARDRLLAPMANGLAPAPTLLERARYWERVAQIFARRMIAAHLARRDED
jgi:hypothetical protein